MTATTDLTLLPRSHRHPTRTAAIVLIDRPLAASKSKAATTTVHLQIPCVTKLPFVHLRARIRLSSNVVLSGPVPPRPGPLHGRAVRGDQRRARSDRRIYRLPGARDEGTHAPSPALHRTHSDVRSHSVTGCHAQAGTFVAKLETFFGADSLSSRGRRRPALPRRVGAGVIPRPFHSGRCTSEKRNNNLERCK